MARWQLTQIRERHFLAARLLAQGIPRATVCQQTGFSPWHFSKLWRSPHFQALFSQARAQLQEAECRAALPLTDRLQEEAIASIQKLKAIRDFSSSTHCQLKATQALLALWEAVQQAKAHEQQPDKQRIVIELPPGYSPSR
jgi:hypothetical protein